MILLGGTLGLSLSFLVGVFLLSILMLPGIKMGGRFEIDGGADNPAFAAQDLLSRRFGIEGTPDVLLIAGQPGGSFTPG